MAWQYSLVQELTGGKLIYGTIVGEGTRPRTAQSSILVGTLLGVVAGTEEARELDDEGLVLELEIMGVEEEDGVRLGLDVLELGNNEEAVEDVDALELVEVALTLIE